MITSASGAALHDILNVSGQRSPWVPIVLVPSAVQGAGAPAELIAAHGRRPDPDVDVIILARGGGSLEDLWCFNDEGAGPGGGGLPVPVVSGVGHETDFTICDYVADVRASTPSNAAEIVFPDRAELMGKNSAVSGRAEKSDQLAAMAARDRLREVSPEPADRDQAIQVRRERLRVPADGRSRSRKNSGGTMLSGWSWDRSGG